MKKQTRKRSFYPMGKHRKFDNDFKNNKAQSLLYEICSRKITRETNPTDLSRSVPGIRILKRINSSAGVINE